MDPELPQEIERRGTNLDEVSQELPASGISAATTARLFAIGFITSSIARCVFILFLRKKRILDIPIGNLSIVHGARITAILSSISLSGWPFAWAGSLLLVWSLLLVVTELDSRLHIGSFLNNWNEQ